MSGSKPESAHRRARLLADCQLRCGRRWRDDRPRRPGVSAVSRLAGGRLAPCLSPPRGELGFDPSCGMSGHGFSSASCTFARRPARHRSRGRPPARPAGTLIRDPGEQHPHRIGHGHPFARARRRLFLKAGSIRIWISALAAISILLCDHKRTFNRITRQVGASRSAGHIKSAARLPAPDAHAILNLFPAQDCSSQVESVKLHCRIILESD